jgi:nitrite reductase/ring-hydroxylating ferredoxin subunit
VSSGFQRVTSFVDALIRDRRPRRFPAEPEDAAMMRAAMTLHAAHPGSGEPAPAFVDQLARRLRGAAAAPPSGATQMHRRRFLQAAGVAAAAAAAGVVGDRLIGELAPDERPGGGELMPKNGRWIPVAAHGALAPGRLMRFSAGSVEGVLVNRGGVISALSAVCTHMGCTLKTDEQAGRLVCPCHSATFSLDGKPATANYDLPALPALRTRVVNGGIEVFAT